jgi:striatin 1/3/4
MRFLQMEWHNHERVRNAWEIEREELKQKASKDEGQLNKLRRQVEALEKHVKMLEMSLKAERAKSKTLTSGDKSATEESSPKDSKARNAGKAEATSGKTKNRRARDLLLCPRMGSSANSGCDIAPIKLHNSFLITDASSNDFEKDAQLDRSRKYLSKCVEEITYLLIPPSHPPPPRIEQQQHVSYPQEPQGMTMEDVFRQKSQQANTGFLQHAPNHQPPPAPSAPELMHLSQATHQPLQGEMMTREPSGQHPMTLLSSQFNPIVNAQSHFQPNIQELEKAAEEFNNFGQPVAKEEESLTLVNHRQGLPEGTDGFIFDDAPSLPEGRPPEGPTPRRPDQDMFPSATIPVKSPPRTGPGSHRRRSSGSTGMARRRSQEQHEAQDALAKAAAKQDLHNFKVKFALRGHLDVVRSVIFTGGGSPSEPEICTAGDDGMIKRWIIPASYGNYNQHGAGNDLDIQSYFTHRGHEGVVTSLAACPATATFSTGGRVSGDGWIFSGGQDATVRVWERGRVDPKATLDGHTDAVWAVCVLPATSATVFGQDCNNFGGPDRVLLASGSADGTIKIWAVSAPPQLTSPSTAVGSRRGVGGTRRHSVTSGSNFPSSPQPSIATSTPFNYTLVHSIERFELPSPTCIAPLSPGGENFVVSFTDAKVLIFDTRTGEEVIGMASDETYDGTAKTGINAIVATAVGSAEGGEGAGGPERGDDTVVHGATGSSERGGVEGVVVSGHEDQFIRFFDANSGMSHFTLVSFYPLYTETRTN